MTMMAWLVAKDAANASLDFTREGIKKDSSNFFMCLKILNTGVTSRI
jgi:hypothetical protein